MSIDDDIVERGAALADFVSSIPAHTLSSMCRRSGDNSKEVAAAASELIALVGARNDEIWDAADDASGEAEVDDADVGSELDAAMAETA